MALLDQILARSLLDATFCHLRALTNKQTSKQTKKQRNKGMNAARPKEKRNAEEEAAGK
jgi:hypothetical protein